MNEQMGDRGRAGSPSNQKVEIYDTTLRDGTQAEEIAFTVEDKLRIAEKLDGMGFHFIEGGWPGANPKDDEFFRKARSLHLQHACLVAFGSTMKRGGPAASDRVLQGLLKAQTSVVTIFGKSWELHVREALHATLDENLGLIGESVRFLKGRVEKVFYDAEHFFDGWKANQDYALQSIRTAVEAGADRVILCDTNGGSLPSEVRSIVASVREALKIPIGIHCHNDSELAVANSLAAVESGATQIHGTVNGIGERCGNANLISVIPNLKLKMGIDCIPADRMKRLRDLSRFVDELANRMPQGNQAYVGDSAFAHKGGVHVSAVLKNRATYEHIDPESVGNRRRVLVSDLSGQSNMLYKAEEFGLKLDPKSPAAKRIVREVKDLENKGFQFEGAEASLEILMRRAMKQYRPYFRLVSFRVIDEKGKSGSPHAVAEIKVNVNGKTGKSRAKGTGPVNALDHALRNVLEKFYPQIKQVTLVDYKVRVLPAGKGTASQVRVLIESRDRTHKWGTVGVSENIIQASWQALVDSLEYKLLKDVTVSK